MFVLVSTCVELSRNVVALKTCTRLRQIVFSVIGQYSFGRDENWAVNRHIAKCTGLVSVTLHLWLVCG